MSDCTYIDRMSAYHDGELAAEDRVAMEHHIAGGCAACAVELEALQGLTLKLQHLEASPQIPSHVVSRLHRQVDALSDRSVLRFAELLSGIAAALLIMTSLWAVRTPSASAAPMVEWERAAVTLRPEVTAVQQPGSLHAAEWIVNDLSRWRAPSMSKTKAVMLFAFVLTMAAGVSLGMLSSRSLPQRGAGQSWLADELQLTAAQEKQMHEIWTGLMQSKGREFGEQIRSLQQEREAAVAGLLTDDQKVELDKINNRFAQRARDLWKQAEQQFQAASEKTRSILNEAQRPKYDALLEKFRADGASGSWVFGPGAKGQTPSSRPAK